MMLRRRVPFAAALAGMLLTATAWATDPPPAPPYPPPPPPPRHAPPPRFYGPPRVAPPPPLSPVMRAIYAPFYAAGLVVRYGFYYVIVAPFEVFGRTVAYGEKGGVDRRPPPVPEGDDR